MTAIIRTPRPADVPGLAAVHVAGWRDSYGHLLPERFYDDAALARRISMWARIITELDPARTVQVAEIDGAVVGFGMCGPTISDGAVRDRELYSLYVLTVWHGTGVGQALLDAVLGNEPAQLWVVQDNARALAFYRRNGFGADGGTRVEEHLENLAEVRLVR